MSHGPQGPVVRQLSFTEPPSPASHPPAVDEGAAVAVRGVGVGTAVADVGVIRAANPPPAAADPAPVDEPPPHPLPCRSGRIRRRPDRYGETPQASRGPKPTSGRIRRPPCRYQSTDFRKWDEAFHLILSLMVFIIQKPCQVSITKR